MEDIPEKQGLSEALSAGGDSRSEWRRTKAEAQQCLV